jgi:hypothetical protein
MRTQPIDQVFWYQKRNSMVVTYRDGDPDRTTETQATATKLANTEGLVRVPSRQGICRWVRNPESRRRTWYQGTPTSYFRTSHAWHAWNATSDLHIPE